MQVIDKEFSLNDYQWKFVNCTAKHRAIFSEFQSGKTMIASIDLVKHLKEYPGLQAAVIRNINYDLMSSTLPNLKEIYDWDLTGDDFNKTYKILELKNGSRVLFIALDRPDDVRKLKNIRLGYVMIDQAEEIAYEVFEMAIGRMSRPPSRSVTIGNFEGRGWYWHEFFENPIETGTGVFKGKQRDYGVFKGADDDHIGFWPPPFLNEKNVRTGYYDEMIATHSSDWTDKYVFGLPTGNAGMVHRDYSEDRHLIRAAEYFEPPKHISWERYEGMDYGISNPTAWLFVVYDREKDIIYFLDEHYEANQNIQYHGPKVKSMRTVYGSPILTVGCPRAFQTEKDGRTPADEYRLKYQINLTQYPIGIEARVEIVNRRFKQNKIRIFDRCQFLRRQIEGMTWKNLEKEENHALEAFHRIVAKIDTMTARNLFRDDDTRRPEKRSRPETARIMEMQT